MSKIGRLLSVNHAGLPRLPIPELGDTMTRYLASVRPLASDAEYNEQVGLVEAFTKGTGKELQQSLVARDAAQAALNERPFFHFENYWDDAYLCARCPNPVNISPFYIMQKPSQSTGVENAARFVHGALQWLVTARNGELKDDGGDMSQLAMFLGTTRIPQLVRDTLEFHADTSSHIVVQRSGKFYRVEVMKQGVPASVADLTATFNAIKQNATTDDTPCISSLTTEDRDVWANARTELISSSAANKNSIKDIDTALLMVALDHGQEDGPASTAKSLLHGTAPNATYKNRWYDKHQLVVDDAGNTGMIFEHSFSDGGSWNKAIGDFWPIVTGNHSLSPAATLPFQELSWEFSEKTMNSIKAAEVKLEKDIDEETQVAVVNWEEYGKDAIKQCKVSPDAFVQQAFQVAYQQVHGKPAATYEAAAMRGYFHGRTETIRSLTVEGNDFARSMARGEGSTEVLREKLVAAAKAQSGVARLAAGGQGIDRHLMSLKMEATEHNVVDSSDASLELFSSPLYAQSSTWTLSTSNVTSPFIDYFGFGAVTTHGYGLGYMTFNNRLPIHLSAFRSGETKVSDMADSVEDALRKMMKLF
eukprot:TRINITY_DN7034_c0_g1_i1.p1 TRINITY_DN7034_c0_g1~~TRINITY_DN7034_c0_g1_i1.p1  ORF type:complete len:589 (+),score=168.14 TRINITY_DN7034_c0_g1_i1:55-1821(+)